MCKISVVIPVFNAEKTLKRCINSVLSETLSDFELILINDGSSDSSDDICLQYINKDKRIRYITQKNSGPAVVRNKGIDEAKGDYICFIDSDDYIDPKCFEFMYNNALKTKADIVLCGYFMENDNLVSDIFAATSLLDCSDINKSMIELKSKNLIDPPWNKLYKKDFLRLTGVKMPVGELYEDTCFNLELLKYHPVISVCSEIFYHYILHSGSITRRYNPEKIERIKQRARQLKEVTDGIEQYCDFYFVKSVFSGIIDMFFVCSKKEIKQKISEEISTEEFKKAAENAYFKGRLNLRIIKAARSGNTFTVYCFCLLSYILKYRMQHLFLKVRGK